MAIYKQEMVQRGHNFVIVDEVDSILIDEARTPLIISGKGEESSKLYEMADYFVARLKKQVFSTTDDKELQDQFDCDYIVDEKERTVSLTQKGIAKAEEFFGVENLADAENSTLNAPHQSGHEGPRTHEARHRLRRQGRCRSSSSMNSPAA